jgi:hypothetical protein
MLHFPSLGIFIGALGDFPICTKSAKVRRIPRKFAKRGNFPRFWQPALSLQEEPAGFNLRLSCRPMKRSSKSRMGKSSLPDGYPKFAVSRDTIRNFFHPEISTSTFHDLVKNRVILPFDGLRGFYKLKESLLRLGLRPVSALPTKKCRSGADMLRWAFSMIEPRLFPVPAGRWIPRSVSSRGHGRQV